jgi:tol-pal system protein YbgF
MEWPMNERFALPIVARAALMLFLVAAVAAGPLRSQAFAQSSPDDVRALLDRVDRLQRDLNTLQRQVYQGGAPPAQRSGSSSSGPSQVQGGSATDLEVRLESIEEQMQSLRGAVEQANFQAKSVQDRLDKLSSDVDFRLSALEKKAGMNTGSVDIPPAGGSTAAPGAPAAPATGGGGAPRVGVLGQIPTGVNSNAPGSITASPPPPSAPLIPDAAAPGEGGPAQGAALPPGSPKDQYAYAFGLLHQNNYAGGERALKAFLSAHPGDPLAGNAQYWLGRTYYARNDFNDAVRAFAEGYQKYPKNQYAAENLLYLGRSLSGINRKSDACEAYSRLLREYPKASDATKNSVQAERKKLACG